MKRVVVLIFMILAPLGGPYGLARAEFWENAPGTRDAATCGETTEAHISQDESFRPWLLDPGIFDEDQGDRTEKRQIVEKEAKTIKLTDRVQSIHFDQGEAKIPEEYLEKLRKVLESMRDRSNVRLHFVGHADSQQLSPTLQAQYGDNIGLSRERAGAAAEFCQQALNLPPEAISYEGLGDSHPIAGNTTESGRALNRRVEVEVWYDEITEKQVEKEVIVPHQVHRVKVCRTETVCIMRYKEGQSHRTRVKNLITPLHYDEGMVSVPETFLERTRQALVNLSGKRNIVVKFIAYTDNAPLAGRDKRIYGNQLGLSKAVARRVSLAVQEVLGVSSVAVESEGKGAARPAASNETPQGRAMNRRVEVEFWHDDPLQDLPKGPQLCPEDAGAETVTQSYNPPEGQIEPILFEGGKPILPPGYIERLQGIMASMGNKANARLRFIGYLSNERLDRRTAAIYGDDIGWSTARAHRAMEIVSEQMGLTEDQVEFEGRGYVQSEDVVNAGFIESGSSRVEVEVLYDVLVALDKYDGVDITHMTREVKTADPFELNLMRITVDGKPVDDPGKSIPDMERCTDVALDKARIEFKYDNLKTRPKLNVTAWPRTIRYRDQEKTEAIEDRVQFRLYTNYHNFIRLAEVRVFAAEQSPRDTPLAIIPMDGDGQAQWQAGFMSFSAPVRQLKYLARVYGSEGRFDETATQPLWVVDQLDSVTDGGFHTELLAGYGDSRLSVQNIPLTGGTVQAYGDSIPNNHRVWLAGYPIPVDSAGRFIAEEILPEGRHTVEVAVLDESGEGELFMRDLELKENDWFTVGIADLTLASNKTSGPAELLAQDKSQYSDDTDIQGRLAFYSKGKFGKGWGLTASADTREGPLDEIFSNFLDKSPESLFRRFNPDYHYPTFGDDSTVVEDAPTSGKFYVKVNKEENYGLWGNFKVDYTDNDLAHVDRGLYGGNLHFQGRDATSFGERRFMADGFAAEPGTVAGRDEFRGTGGSLYFLHRQDLLEGSERLRIEVRDKDSGMVIGVKNLTSALDYSVDYLQGRLLLSKPLPSTADDSLLVHNDGAAGNPVFLVVRYEYTPGVEELDVTTLGGRAHYWLNDHFKIGLTSSRDKEAGNENNLDGADVTLRKSATTWAKIQTGSSEGSGLLTTNSLDGGFNFDSSASSGSRDITSQAYRTDLSVGLRDLNESWQGQVTLYNQELEAGYAAPGVITDRDVSQYGGSAELPLFEKVNAHIKIDKKVVDQGLEMQAGEMNLDYQANDHWTMSSGVRSDSREDRSATVPLTQKEGDRTDVVVKALYDSKSRWTGYGFVQESVQTSGNREKNSRIGSGGSYRVTNRFKTDGELSTGDLGTGGRLGTEYLYSDRTTMYLNYALENERTDNGVRARKGNMASGFRTRYSDSASVYFEERYTHGDVPTGLMHSTGVDLAPADHLNFGANLDSGTLRNNLTGAELKRTAAGVSAGYDLRTVKLASALEYRVDDTEQPDTSTTKRTTWLLKNSFKYQLSNDWRMVGKFNYAQSESSQGQFYDGNFTEAVMGYAYRPVENDRLNALLKYTYFYNVPAAEQTSSMSTDAGVIQRSHITALDVMYDVTAGLTLGGKYAYRLGQVSLDRVNPEFFDSRASLYIARIDWHVVHRWDVLVEGRLLDLPDAQDSLSGALAGVYRHLGNHMKLGIGYNSSKFSDDLTDLSYDHQGLFINLIGKI